MKDMCLHGLACVPQTGVVQVNRRLDRERLAEYVLTVTVKDNPENPRIARRVCSLSLSVSAEVIRNR